MWRGGGGGENSHNRDKGSTTAPCKLRLWLQAAGWGWDAAACWPRALWGTLGQTWGQHQHSGAVVAPFPLPSCSVCQLLLPGASRGAFPPALCFTVSRASPPKAPQLFCLPPSPAGVLGAYLPSSPPRAAEIPRVPRDPLCSASLWPRGAALAGCGGPCSLAPGWEFRKNWFGKTRCLHASTSQAGAASPEACDVASSRVSRTHTGRAPRNGGDALSTESWQMRLTRTGVSPLG